MQLPATTTGRVSKTFFGKGTYVKVGDPFAVIVHESDEGPRGGPTTSLQIVSVLREKPAKRKGNVNGRGDR